MSCPAREQVDPFDYPADAEPRIPCGEVLGGPWTGLPGRVGVSEIRQSEREDELQRSFETGRAQGVEEGRALERQARSSEEASAEERRATELSGLVARFSADRDRFFEQAEPEVAKLALAIAARILRRECSVDPLLLSDAVRTALGRLSDSTEARLRVPAADFELWAETIRHLPKLRIRPTVVADGAMCTGDCVIETRAGTADVGLSAQLDEMERGLFGATRNHIDHSQSANQDGGSPPEVHA